MARGRRGARLRRRIPQAEPATGANIGFSGSIDAANPDVAVTLGILADVTTRFAVDTTRVIVTGVSQGAAFTNRLAVQYPHLFAAIAPCYSGHLNAASYTNPIVRTDVPLPVWQCRGVNEVPTDYPGGTAGEAAAKLFWREAVNMNAGPPTVEVDGRYTTDIYHDGVAEYRWTVNGDIGHFWPANLGFKLWDDSYPVTVVCPTVPCPDHAHADAPTHERGLGILPGPRRPRPAWNCAKVTCWSQPPGLGLTLGDYAAATPSNKQITAGPANSPKRPIPNPA